MMILLLQAPPGGGWMPGMEPGGLGWPGLLVALYCLAGLISGALAAQAAFRRGLNPWTGFLCGFLLPIAGWLAICCRKTGPVSPRPIRTALACAACGAMNHPAAKRCLDCGATLDPRTPSEADLV
ncbi:MAG: hypothetical protein IPM24_27665 [Bryobacterales bacterium]|nr:hypothetical protein [Bryobacterales bacterium]